MKKLEAFSLAEILITLSVVGIIAVLTIPNLILKYNQKVLETQFKKNYAALQSALQLLTNEGYDSYSELQNTPDRTSKNTAHLKKLKPYFKDSQLCTKHYLECGGSTRAKGYQHYSNTSYAHIDADSTTNLSILTADGALIWMGPWGVNGYHVDINGPQKGPNLLGHDMFSFTINQNNTIEPYTRYGNCTYNTPNQGLAYNGFTCSQHAIKNVCPDDQTKTYWECLR